MIDERYQTNINPTYFDTDEGHKFTVHLDWASFQNHRGANYYAFFCILNGFDDIVDDDDQIDLYEIWCCEVTVDEVEDYYTKNLT